MAKRYYDLVVFVPLEEELHQVVKVFVPKISQSNDLYWRYEVDCGVENVSVLLVQHGDMGKSAAGFAFRNVANEFEIGIAVCLGIAGAISKDLRLGDVCYSGQIADVLDNSKASDTAADQLDVALSPKFYTTPRNLTTAFNFMRTMPELNDFYNKWQSTQFETAQQLLSGPEDQSTEKIIRCPETKDGTIVCGLVSQSGVYNAKLKDLDRKLLAIETESGGLFPDADMLGVPFIVVRGISDHADKAKADLESSTGNQVRAIAALNAASFLAMQLRNPNVRRIIESRRQAKRAAEEPELPFELTESLKFSTVLERIGGQVDEKLRELSPGYSLQEKGYRLPIPRVHQIRSAGFSGKLRADPIDVREALTAHSAILLSLPRTYPDHSVAWVIAGDLLTSEIGGKQIVPIVIDGNAIRPPKFGLLACADDCCDAGYDFDGSQKLFIINDLPYSSRTKIRFLIDEVKLNKGAKFIFIARGDSNIIRESELIAGTNSDLFELGEVSFEEMAHFVQKKFSLGASESEVVALRLRNTFDKFDLSAYPSYFAGIPWEAVGALLKANRRAELIQLATVGFLSFVVADDNAEVQLTRSTRERFLQKLVVALRVEKRALTQEETIAFTKRFAEEYDFDIDPLSFINAFVDKGILRFEDNILVFSLAFIEEYLLANALAKDNDLAKCYFVNSGLDFDESTFDLYAEIGPSKDVVEYVISEMNASLVRIGLNHDETHILLTDRLRPALIEQPQRVEALRQRLIKTAEDVQRNHGDLKEKQKLLDATDRVRAEAAAASDLAEGKSREKSEGSPLFDLERALKVWTMGTTLLGSGAEHLDGEVRKSIAVLLVRLASMAMHRWAESVNKFDFADLKRKLTSDDAVSKIVELDATADQGGAKRFVSGVVDLIEFGFLSDPVRRLIHHLCEGASHKVLASTVANALIRGRVERVIQGAWLADIDAGRGKDLLKLAMKDLPHNHFLRMNLATHFLTRVYWSHWQQKDRMILLDAAQDAIQPLSLDLLNKGELKRIIESTPPAQS